MTNLERKMTPSSFPEPDSEVLWSKIIEAVKSKDRIVHEPVEEDRRPSLSITMFNQNFGKQLSDNALNADFVIPPRPVRGVPNGLELLVPLNYVSVKKRPGVVPSLMQENSLSSYEIYDPEGHRLYYAVLNSKRRKKFQCSGRYARLFEIDILDYSGRIVISIERPSNTCLKTTALPCFCWIFGSCGGSMTVWLGDGSSLGKIIHKNRCYRPIYKVKDQNGERAMKIRGPTCADCCIYDCCRCEKSEFQITSVDGQDIGCISQVKYVRTFPMLAGSTRRSEGNSGNFGIKMKPDLNARKKALMIAAAFLIHHMHYHTHHEEVVTEEELMQGKYVEDDHVEDDPDSDPSSQNV